MGTLLMFIGIVLLILAEVVGIGSFLYNWGVEDVKIGLAAWNGFVTWFQFIITGIIALIIGAFIDTVSKPKSRWN